jgi:meso-butanediol dehydrogenase/(S,S)-butanediol dehydrogenase/diacetyl reductase
MTFAGKVVLVTGGGTGIGAACARRFAAEGARVAVIGRRLEPLKEVAAGIGGLALAGDAAEPTFLREALDTIRAHWGGLDVLIAAAGSTAAGAALQTSDQAWAAGLRANLTTAFVAARESLPYLLERCGSIVIISSIAGLAAGTEVCGYTTAKHALIGLARSLARDYGPQGVRVNVVCPGWVKTPMADAELQSLAEAKGLTLEETYALVTRDVPLRRAAEPEEIAAVCRFLASEEASIITGAVVTADGGATIVDVPTLAFCELD